MFKLKSSFGKFLFLRSQLNLLIFCADRFAKVHQKVVWHVRISDFRDSCAVNLTIAWSGLRISRMSKSHRSF